MSVENLSNLIFSLFTSCKVVSSKDCKATVTARSKFALCSSLANGIILSEENFAQDSRTRCGNPVFNEVSLNFFTSFRSFSALSSYTVVGRILKMRLNEKEQIT